MLQKKQLKSLIDHSYNKDDIEEESILQIAEKLKRSELKQYIQALRQKQRMQSAVITLPFPPTEEERKKHQLMYPNKKIIYEVDPSLFLGARIKQDDTITEYSVKDSLTAIAEYLEDEYDKQ